MEIVHGQCVASVTLAQITLSLTSGKDLAAYITVLIRYEQEWLCQFAKPCPADDQFIHLDEDNSPAVHIEVLNKFLSILDDLTPETEISSPVLWLPDLNRSHVFVSLTPPHEIPSIIGWQTAIAGLMYL